jgi:hypothetical protein
MRRNRVLWIPASATHPTSRDAANHPGMIMP